MLNATVGFDNGTGNVVVGEQEKRHMVSIWVLFEPRSSEVRPQDAYALVLMLGQAL